LDDGVAGSGIVNTSDFVVSIAIAGVIGADVFNIADVDAGAGAADVVVVVVVVVVDDGGGGGLFVGIGGAGREGNGGCCGILSILMNDYICAFIYNSMKVFIFFCILLYSCYIINY
jgi:hypothetical protein